MKLEDFILFENLGENFTFKLNYVEETELVETKTIEVVGETNFKNFIKANPTELIYREIERVSFDFENNKVVIELDLD